MINSSSSGYLPPIRGGAAATPQQESQQKVTPEEITPPGETSIDAAEILSHQAQLHISDAKTLVQTYNGPSELLLEELDSLYPAFVEQNTFSNATLLRDYVSADDHQLTDASTAANPNGCCVNQAQSLLCDIRSKLDNPALGGLALFSKNGKSDHLSVFIPVHNPSDETDCGIFLFERGGASGNPIFVPRGSIEVSYSELGRDATDAYTFVNDTQIMKETTETGKGIVHERKSETSIDFNPSQKKLVELSQNFVNGKRSLIFRANASDGKLLALLGIKLDENMISFKTPEESGKLGFEDFQQRYESSQLSKHDSFDTFEIMLSDQLSLNDMAKTLNVDPEYLASELLFSIKNHTELIS